MKRCSSFKEVVSSRRAMIKSVGAGGAGLFGFRSIPKPTRASSGCPTADPNDDWLEEDYYENASGKNEGIYLTFDVGSMGAQWNDQWEVWEYYFKQQSVSKSQEYPSGDSLSALKQQEVKIAEGTTANFQPYLGDCYIGARPKLPNSDASHYNYYEMAYEVAKPAVSAIKQRAGYLITAADLVEKYMDDDEGLEGSDWDWHRVWDYYSDHYYLYEELSHYNFWELWVEQGDTDYFDVKTKTTSYWDNNPSISMTFELYSGNPPTRYSVSTTTTAEGYQREFVDYSSDLIPDHDWQVERIPNDKIINRIQRGDVYVSPNSLNRLLESGDPLYYAHNPPIRLVETEKTFT